MIRFFIFLLFLTACTGSKTPAYMLMSQEEKIEVNYDQRENQKFLEKNRRSKKSVERKKEKFKKKQQEELNELNKGKKTKKKNNGLSPFPFY